MNKHFYERAKSGVFYTYQGKDVIDKLRAEGSYSVKEYYPDAQIECRDYSFIENVVGYKPIFCAPIRRTTLYTQLFSLLICPSNPEFLILFKPKHKVHKASLSDIVEAFSKNLTSIEVIEGLTTQDKNVKDYMTDAITMDEVLAIIDIREVMGDTNADIQDVSLNYIYSENFVKDIKTYCVESVYCLDTNDLALSPVFLEAFHAYMIDNATEENVTELLEAAYDIAYQLENG